MQASQNPQISWGGGVYRHAVECTPGSHWTQIPRRGPFKFLTLCKEPIECTDIYGLQVKYRRLMTITSNHNMGRRKTMNIKKKAGTEPTRNTRQIEA
jgi:hypothetical protein